MSTKIKKLAAARKAGVERPASRMSLVDLENLFVEKLQEKFNITEKNIQRTFTHFDKKGAGHLSIAELTSAIHLYLNGVERSQVQELVTRYDVDGDGEISIVELSKFLVRRNCQTNEEWLSIDHLTQNRTNSGDVTELRDTSKGKVVPSSSTDYKAKIFLTNVRSNLMKKALDTIAEGKVSRFDRLTSHRYPLAESTAREILRQSFNPYILGKETPTIDFAAFTRILLKYVYPGSPPPSEETLMFIFSMCLDPDLGERISRIDPAVLVEVIFHQGDEHINQFGFKQTIPAVTDTGRPENGRGPFSTKKKVLSPTAISDVPLKFVTPRCHTALATPSDFDVALIDRSRALPEYMCQREHVYGISTNLYSGPRIQSMSCSIAPAPPSSSFHRSSSGGDVNTVVYAAGALGVVHELTSNTQLYFEGHSDDVTCLSVSYDGTLVASGQMGRLPELLVWRSALHIPQPVTLNDKGDPIFFQDANGLVARVGKGFFSRGVCATDISFDNTYVVGLSCDDKHTLGVWEIASGSLVASMPSANGIPPQVVSDRVPSEVDISDITKWGLSG